MSQHLSPATVETNRHQHLFCPSQQQFGQDLAGMEWDPAVGGREGRETANTGETDRPAGRPRGRRNFFGPLRRLQPLHGVT